MQTRQLSMVPPGTSPAPSPTAITMEEAEAVLGTTKTFIELGLPGRKLDEIRDESTGENVQSKWQRMMEIRLRCELHVINAFGYEASEMGMMAYRQTMSALLQRTLPQDMARIQGVDQEIWAIMIRRTFNVETESIDLGKGSWTVGVRVIRDLRYSTHVRLLPASHMSFFDCRPD